MCSHFCAAQEFLWANGIGSKGTDIVHSVFPIDNGYVMPVTYRDSFYALGNWNYSLNSLNSMYLSFYTNTGKLRKLVKTENDSINLSSFNSIENGIISAAGSSIIEGCFFNGEFYNPAKKQYVLELDTFGKISFNLEIQCKAGGVLIEPRCGVSCNRRIKNRKILALNIHNTSAFSKTYYFNKKDSIILTPKEYCVLFILEDINNKIISLKKLIAPISTGGIAKLGNKYLVQSFINFPKDSFKFNGNSYLYESMNNCLILELDSMMNLKKIQRQVGEEHSFGNGFISISTMDTTNYLTANLAYVNKSEVKKIFILGDSIELFRTTNTIINLQKSERLTTKLIRLKDKNLSSNLAVQGLSCVSSKEFCVITGQIGGECIVFPDSIIVHSNSNDGNFFMMKMDTFGNILWYYVFGKKGTSEYAANAIIEDDGVVVSGTFDSTTTLGNYTLTSNGGTDALLFKITDNSIYRGNIKKGPYCAGDSIEVPYRAYGKYADTNTFFAELSDENGNFYGTPRQLGSLKTNALQGTIRGVLPLFDVVSSGKYRIRIRSNSPFVQSFMRYDSLYLLIYSKDKANPGADTTICVGDTLQLKTTGGTRWHWSPGTAVTDSTARVTQFVGKQNTRLRIAISDSSGCGAPDTAWKYIALYPKLAVTAKDTVVCRNTSFYITATVEGGRPSSRSVQWYAGTTYLGKDTLKSSTWFDTSFMAVATDGCASNTDTTRVRVSLPNPPSLSINDTTVCAGSLLLWQPTITGYKDRPVQLSWYRGTTKLADSLLQLQVDSNQVLWLHGDDYCAAAENRKEVHIEVFEKPTVSVVIDSICAEVGHTLIFTAAGGKGPYTYWLNDQQVSKSAYALVQPSQWLRWYAQDACQQKTVLDSVPVHQQPRGQIMAAPENGCAPLMVNLRSNQTNTTWYIENQSIQGQDTLPYWFTKAGVYTVKMVVENGECKDSVSKQIEVYESPKAWFEIQQRDLLVGEARTRVINTSGPAKRYIWYWKDSMRESSSVDAWALHLQDTGMSKVWMIAENIHGCRDTFTDTVYVHPQPVLWIPTAITLNGDGLNDALAAGGIGLKSYRFMVFNRWGEMVFSGKENEEWRPSSTVLPGMYVYRCIYSNWKGTKFEQNGTVMLLR